MLLLAKIVLVPCIIALITVAGRVWGPQLSGVLAGLPVIAGPILIFLALDFGDYFGAASARGLLLGVISLGLFCCSYAYACRRQGVFLSLVAGVSCFFLSTLALSVVHLSSFGGLVAVTAALIGYACVFPSPLTPPVTLVLSVREISARMATAALLVLVITSSGESFGPHLSGLLAPFPVAGTVLAGFTHHYYGSESAIRLLRGFIGGLFGMAAFAFIMASLLPSAGLAFTTSLALLCALLGGTVASRLLLRRLSTTRA